MPLILNFNIFYCSCGAVFKRLDTLYAHAKGRNGHGLAQTKHIRFDSRNEIILIEDGQAKKGYES